MKHIGNLTVTTPSDREIQLSRVFDAPRKLVFDALTKPELIKRWLSGPPGWSMTTCEMDAKVGGTYRYLWRGPDGIEMGMRGVIREIVAPERLVATEVFDQSWYVGEAIDTTVLVEKDGKTTLTITVRYDSKEIRDEVLKSPMAEGMSAGYDRLDEFLASEQGGEIK
jgi:uncharacterized protein YndB with AHSA1/START domain